MRETRPFNFELSDFSKDQLGNLYVTLPGQYEMSILQNAQVKAQAVITPLGLKRSTDIDRQLFFSQALENNLKTRPMKNIPESCEASLFEIKEKDYVKKKKGMKGIVTSIFNLSNYSLLAVKKNFYEDSLLASELIQLFDQLKPMVEQYHCQLIQPYGGVGRTTFSPFIPGTTLTEFMKFLYKNTNNYSFFNTFESTFSDEISIPLSTMIQQSLTKYLFNLNFTYDPDFSRNGFTKNGHHVFARQDISPMLPLAYNNWIVSPGIEGRVLEHINSCNLTEGLSTLLSGLTIIDPVYVGGELNV